MKIKQKYKRDERLSFWGNFIYEFGLVFLIVFVNSHGHIMLYNRLIREQIDVYRMSVYMLMFLLVGCTISAVLVYLTRARIYSRNIQLICKAAQRVAEGDFSVHIETFPEKMFKNELDILKEDFNKMVRELSSIENIKDDFVADVSHEIKTPLSLIQGYADLLQTPGLSNEKRSEYIQLISQAIHKLNDLVENILRLNKVENKNIIHKEKFFLDEQIRCAIISFEDKFDEKNISLEAELDEVVIRSDRASLELVWNNILSNAVKFTPCGGIISVSLKEKNDCIVATIKDNGCGMDEETQKRIFEKFYQGDSSHSSEGNGLGLALVKKIVDMLDGSVRVRSKVGKGTEFEVVLRNM